MSESPDPRVSSFADHLALRLRALGHPLCLGLDPDFERLPPLFREAGLDASDPAAELAVVAFCRAMLERAAGRVAIVKPQVAFFEALGWRGMRALDTVVAEARSAGFLVLLDAKRGDVGSTAAAYVAAYLDAAAPIAVDAITVNPYLGLDALAPFLATAQRGRGVFVLVRTSNPGAADFQDRAVDGGRELHQAVAAALAAPAEALAGPVTGWSSLGVVAGATWPGEAERLREILPRALFLVPGYGAQGGTARDAVRGFVPGPAGLEGGLVNASRSLLFPPGSDTGDAGRWERAVDAALDRAVGELGQAIR